MDIDVFAPRRCFSEPVPAVLEAARLLDAAVDAHLAGDRLRAPQMIKQADIPAITDWQFTVMGPVNPEITRFRAIDDAPPYLPKEERVTARMPYAAERRALKQRDGWTCRFCGMPVIGKRVREAMRHEYPEALRWARPNAERHAAFLCMWLQYDHLLPHSRGGDNSLENIVITCAPCNFGRGDHTLEEVGLIDPRTRPIQRSAWDGLERFIQAR